MADKDDDDVDDVDKDEPEDEYEAPDKETWTSTTAALTKANAEAKKWRMRAQGKDEKWTVPGFKRDTPPEDDEEDEEDDAKAKSKPARRRQPRVDEEKIRREAEEAAMAKAKPGLVRTAAKDAFKAAGLILPEKGSHDTAFARVTRLINLDDVDVDDDGEVTGLDDQVKAIKRDYPELFTRRGASRVNAGAGSSKDGAGDKVDSSANKLAALINGG